MAVTRKLNIKKNTKALKKDRVGEFSRKEIMLLSATGIVAFGGILFCTLMIILMTSINY